MLFRATQTLHSSLTRWLLCPGCVAVSFLFSLFLFSARTSAQSVNAAPGFISKIAGDQSTQQVFIENIGQYGSYLQGREQMGAIRFGYEGLDMPVLFTPKGIIHLQRKLSKLSHEEEERLERAGAKEEQIERERNTIDRTITMEWLGANEHAAIVAEGKTFDYHTYGLLPEKAFGYRQLTYKDLYPGIDIVYHFSEKSAAGFEYSLVVHPGADLREVKLRYGGDVKKIKVDSKGNLEVRSDIDGISSTVPVSYYGEKAERRNSGNVKSAYQLNEHDIRFALPEGYDKSRSIVVDPFVSSTSNLTGVFAGKAIDVDYDYAGNVYVAGGGNTNQTGTASHSHAKYNSAGVLQWTFNGVLSIPVWTAGYYYGGWVVDKASGSLYIGQGFAFQGFQVIRVSTTGLYDNYITTANSNFQEDWKMYWYCNNGNPQIICAGGGTTTNNNIAICSPPSTTLAGATNLTGAASAYQDMSDLVIDPVTNSLYTIYASGLDKTIENRIFKHNAPYTTATTAWSTPSGYVVLGEILNRPYLGGSYADNSSNILAVNANYLFYWDGLNLKAIDKATGATVGTPISLAGNLALRQGGVVADACDNVYIGNGNGTIKVYKFNGSNFDDAAANDISIPGYSTAVYDLALDESKKLLYASGDGFVASFDVSAYCPITNYTVTVVPNCVNGSATASISPAPPPGSTVTYSLFIGNAQVGNSNTTGVFTGLSPNTNYSVVATINLACSGTQTSANFILPGPTITFTQTNTTCGASSGSITAAGSGTAGPYSYSLNGGPFQSSGSFTGLAAGIYTLVVQGAGGCPNDTVINILNSNGPTLTHTQTDATCGSNTGTVTASASGGATPYEYSIDNGANWQSNSFFTGLTAGDYILAVRDASGCINRQTLTIVSSPAVILNAIPGSATCGLNNGSITAFGSGGTAPLQYSINGNTFQASNTFANVSPGSYTVTVKDAIGCSQTFAVTVDNVPPPTVSATTASATCSNSNGSITVTGSNGIPPYQYSINGGVTYQPGNVFGSLAPGAYTITIKDSKGCTGSVGVNVASINGPAITATATSSSCAGPTGSITATASGGAVPYQYSINGTTFSAAATFSNLPPGNYVVFVRDNSGCIATVRVVVGATAGPSLSVSATPASCVANNGTITATGSGGTAPLQYSIDGITYTASNSFSGLASALYTVYVKDANGCIKSGTAIVGNASGLSIAVSPVTSSCSASNGVLTITATGGIAPLQYSIDGVVYQASASFINLAPGNYTAFVKDANGCIVSKQTVVSTVAGPSFSLTVKQNATCGTASGVISVTASGGVAPLSYSIDGGAYQPAPFFVAVAAGTHTITVKDAAGCTAPAQPVTISNSITGTAITDVTFVARDVLDCIGEGRIKNLKGFPTGGGNNYEFSLDGGGFVTANQFRPVSVGYHVITARNKNSLCTISKLVQIGKGTPATATFVATPSACGASTGSITITGVGANTPYHASIDNGVTWQTFASTFTFTGLAPGTYPIEIADDADFTTGPPDIPGACTSFIYATVPSTGGPSLSATQTTPTCTDNTATVTATGSAGTAPYTYSIDNSVYSAGNVFTGIAPGNHALSVKDATGCTNGITITIANATAPTVTAVVNATSCGENNGSIKATGTGGTAPLEYSIDGTVYVTNNVFSNLKPGSYTLYVRDVNKCFSSVDVTIANTPLPKVTAYSITATCTGSDGSIVADVTGGEGPFTFSINGTAYQSSPTFTDLPAGFYTVYAKDARGCTGTTTVTIASTGGPVATLTSTAATCGNSNGSLMVTASGGLAPYQYSINGNTYQSSNTFTALAAGNYGVWVKDAGGCITAKNILVANTPGPQAPTASLVHAACGGNNGSISLSASGGTAPLQYSIDGTNFFASGNFTNLPAGNYTAIVKDATGCTSTTTLTLQNLTGPALSASSSAASCGKSDGTITSSVNGGTGAISYSIDGVNFQSSSIFVHQPAGSYTLTARDSRGCTAVFSVLVGTIGAGITPTFAPVGPVCANTAIPALPTTSLNGISGVWSPAINNTATTTYTFTPLPGQCANITTLTIAITSQVVPTFTAVAPVCAGATIPALPTTSLNGITGTWSPAINNTATTTYTFTPTAGQCASTTTLTPTFAAVAPVCAGTTIAALPTTSTNGITGTWSPAINNTATTTYTFTPDAGQCASSTTLSIIVNPTTTPAFAAVAPVCAGSTIAPLPATSLNGISGTWSPAINNTSTTTYTFTPTAGQCASTTTLTITVNPTITPTFTIVAPVCAGSTIAPLPTTSLNGITGTWSPAINNTSTTTYTFTPDAGQCASSTTLSITVNPTTTPAFAAVAPVCAGATIAPLPATSLNSVTGTWSPAINNTATTTYTFTPTAGQCASTTTLTITVNPSITPTFNPIPAVCAGSTIAPLPTTSLNNITGTWSPAINNTATTTYTFTPDAGQCASTTTLTITVNPTITPTFTPIPAICAGAGIAPLPTTSLNGITGSWSPALNNNATTTYTFTPNPGQCAVSSSLTITVNAPVIPSFAPVAPACSGSNIAPLPGSSLNGITGTWSPAINNTTTTTYTFTPDAGQCAAGTTLTIVVNPPIIPTFNPVAAVCSGATIAALPTTSLNGVNGSWSPAINNTVTTTYTFTPDPGQCAGTSSLTITVNPINKPTINCGVSTSSSVSFTWNAVAGATGYTIAYQIGTNPVVNVGGIGNVLTYLVSGLNAGDAVQITVTPTGSSTECFAAAVATCAANPCTPPTAVIGYTSSLCATAGPQTVNLSGTGNYNGGVFGAGGGLTIDAVTGTITPASSTPGNYTVTYTIAAAGGCAGVTATATVVITASQVPNFAVPTAVCAGTTIPPLPTTSLNGISGSWSPAINNTVTTTYTFTPDPGQCASSTTLTIPITALVTPNFAPIAPVCAGTIIAALPTVSLNGVSGTWSPAINNTATTTYTFTPTTGQCASSTTLTIVVNPATVPTFNPVPAVCAGSIIAALPTTSLNGINGTWSPAINNTATTTYTFTPTTGQCASSTTLTIVVNPTTVPTFNPVAAFCAGSTIPALPNTSVNGITGTWSPAINNTVTTTYTFTPDAGQCANTASVTITINPIEKPVVNCGVSTSNSVSFTWAAVPGATDYNISYQVGTGPLVNIGPIGNILSYAVNGLNSGDQVNITVLPTNASSGCFAAGTATCNANACTPPTAAIQYNGSWCISDGAEYLPTITGTGSYTGGIFSAGAGLSIDASTGGIKPSGSTAGVHTVTYTVAGTGGCPGVSATAQVTITALKIPSFAPVPAVCAGDNLAQLPTTSINGVTGTWSPALSNTQTTVYTFTPDAGQCAASTTMQVLINPPPSNPTISVVQATCIAPSATVTISNASVNTLYSLDGAAFSAYPAAGYQITLAGAHTLQAQSASGCLSAITTFTTNAAPQGPSSIAIIATDAACGNNNGSISLGAVTGGTAPYSFSINGGAYSSTASYTNLAAGNYSISVKDNNGCVYTTSSAVNNAAGPVFTSTQTPSTCGSADGSITITATGGTAPYHYSKDGTNFQAGNTFSGLTAGSYSIQVKDAAGCISTGSITISGGSSVLATGTATPASCGNADGSITITATGGTAPYQYSKDGTNFQTGNTFTGLASGTYSITVKDASGCSSIVVVSVNGGNGPIASATTTAASCGSADGTIVVSATGGTAPYQYSKDGLSFQAGNAFGSLTAGTYTISVKDAGGCTVTATVTVPGNAGPQLSIATSPASCGLSNGNIVVTATAGTAPYQYAINGGNFQSANNFNALSPGNYTLSVKDATGCTATGTITLTGSSAPVLSATVSNTTCGNANGTIVASASAGTAAYEFSIGGPFQSSNVFGSLSAGNYTIVVKDAAGCTATTVLTVGGSSSVSATATTTPAHCNAADGSLTATGSGGVQPYQYSVNNGSFQSSNLFTGLRSGNYTLVIKDAAGCTSSSPATIASVNPVTVNAGPDQTICAGSSTQLFGSTNATQFQWSPAAGLSNPGILQPVVTISATSTYILTATIGACSASDTVLVKVQPPPVPSAGNDTSICFGNTLTLHGSGGLIYQWSGKGLVSGTNTATPIFTTSLPGKYPLVLSVTDAFGCRAVKNDTVLVTVLTPATIFAGRDTSIALNEPLQLHAVPGAGNSFSSYQWSPPGGLNNPAIADPLFTASTSNVYTYRITATTREGCTATDDITIKVFIKPDLYVPNAFTPNGDGQNDKLRVIPVGIKELHFFTVYSRWGELVFTTKNLSEGWDGMFKGKKQDSGGFVWVAEAVDFSGHIISRKGIAMLLR
jgi:gliding motility-associated-like protein